MHIFTDADWAGGIPMCNGILSFRGYRATDNSVYIHYVKWVSSSVCWHAGTGVTSGGVVRGADGSVQTHTIFPGQSAQDLSVNPVFRSKHIAITFHWVRKHVDPD